MRYTAAALTAAARPVSVALPLSGRFGASWVGRWWSRRFRTWSVRPISTPQMLAIQGARDPLVHVVVMVQTLRAVFPRQWWRRLTGDPVRLIMRLPVDLRTLVLQALVRVPGSERDESAVVDDPIELIRKAQRAAVYGTAARATPTLVSVTLSVRVMLGDTWYYNPARWQTSDGFAPFGVVWLEWVGLQAEDAKRRLEVADGYALAHAKDPKRARSRFEKTAYPTEVC